MILCADDFGLNHPVSTGILDLVKAGKINSVSCLVTTDCWKERVSELYPFLDNIEVGLHLTLTHPKPIHFSGGSFSSLIRKSYLKQLKKQEIIREIRSQMELFRNSMGRMPGLFRWTRVLSSSSHSERCLNRYCRGISLQGKQSLCSCFSSRKSFFFEKWNFLDFQLCDGFSFKETSGAFKSKGYFF